MRPSNAETIYQLLASCLSDLEYVVLFNQCHENKIVPKRPYHPALNNFKDALPLRMRTVVYVQTSMTSFSSRHLRRTMERQRREGDNEEEEEEGREVGGGGLLLQNRSEVR